MNEEIAALIQQYQTLSRNVQENEQYLTDDDLLQFQNHLNKTLKVIEMLVDREKKVEDEAPKTDIPDGAELLWILSGENPEAFTQYLRTYPGDDLTALANNPAHLNYVISELQRRITSPYGQSSEGIPKDNLQSSTVYGFTYDPSSKKLRVKFQGDDAEGQGPVYEYDEVPANIFKMFQSAAIPAKTSGSNKWGRWWVQKSPSRGASMNALIKKGGYNYRKIS